eukprot:5161275-Amphidinium_carterae.1
MCERCKAPESTYHVLWECECFSPLRGIPVDALPPRVCIAAAGLPAAGEMNDTELLAIYHQVDTIIQAYNELRPRATWRAQVAPHNYRVAAGLIRLHGKTPPPPGGWHPIGPSAPSRRPPDDNGH